MSKPKNRARVLLLSHIAQFSLQRRFGENVYGGLSNMAFTGETFGVSDAIPGDLVALQSAPPGKWYLGWLVSKEWPEGHSGETFAIESIEDGKICNWSNVSLIYYNRETVRAHPEWRWTDEQHEFNDRWIRACYKLRDAYIYLPVPASFFDGNSVELGVRVRFGMDDRRPSKMFDNWKKVSRKAMLEFYDAAVEELATPIQRTA